MRIKALQIENFRLLRNFNLELEKELSLVIGKNNTGKTSILSVLNKFLNESDRNRFLLDDFNIDFAKTLKSQIESNTEFKEEEFKPLGIKLKLFIEYDDKDNLANISRVLMDLDPDNYIIVLGFEYILDFTDYLKLRKEYREFDTNEKQKHQINAKYPPKTLNEFLKQNLSSYFKIERKSYEFNSKTGQVNDEVFIDLVKEKIRIEDIVSFKFISAKRDVTNKEIDKTLSSQTSRIYRRTEAGVDQSKAVEEFKDRLSETDSSLSGIYKTLFTDIIDKVRTFGGIRLNESEIAIVSSLQHRELLEGNTTVVYKHDGDSELPEHFNGLGYMNLISMIFEIEILIQEFKRDKSQELSDINLLFIEEPEAHTHPQMQYIFIKNIKDLLKQGIKRSDGKQASLQYVITTHSCHIVADSDFDDIKYLRAYGKKGIDAKNLKDLEKKYLADGQEQNFRFLKQYLTLNRAELFFAEKAILIEGDTERILLPAIMKKIDQQDALVKLRSQNISIVETGAHSHIFDKFIDFIGTKTLIITDIDSYYIKSIYEDDGVTPKKHKNGNIATETIKCPANDPQAKFTSNNSLKFFHQSESELAYYKGLSIEKKKLRKSKMGNWVTNKNGHLFVAFQLEENGYHARSFEDSFFNLNKDFITLNTNSFPSLTSKYLKMFSDDDMGVFDFSEQAVGSKPSLAIEILLNSKTNEKKEYSNWNIPSYIMEGLTWLKQD